MDRTQISLTPVERALLDRESSATGRSMSALIREAVVAHFGEAPVSQADRAAVAGALGAWSDREESGEAFVDRLRSGDRLRPRA